MPFNAVQTVELPCEKPITFEYRGGKFHITDPALGFARCMGPETFFQSIANAVECSRGHRPWDQPSAEIVSLADHAAALRGSVSK
jgi:hypothetical protein